MQDIKGAITALVTPMRDGQVDERSLIDLIEFQIQYRPLDSATGNRHNRRISNSQFRGTQTGY